MRIMAYQSGQKTLSRSSPSITLAGYIDRPSGQGRSPLKTVTSSGGLSKFRVFDLIVLALAFPFVLPLIGILALVVKAGDVSAPAFFLQTRYGLGGRPFKIIKLRTMVKGAEHLKDELADLSECQGAGFKVENDPRITSAGRWLRKLYLDELPQILNVAKGDMSWVGPRANSYSLEMYEPWQLQRLWVPPGITGSWQVMENKPKEFAERCKIDLDYVATKSIWNDIKILFGTFHVCLAKRSGE